MKKVTVKTDALLTKLRENRNEHRGIFEAAQKSYRARVIQELDQQLERARAGGEFEIDRLLVLQAPEDHTQDYDRVIKMAEMSVNLELELEASEFQQYVMDVWSWSRGWASNATQYGVRSAKLNSLL